MRIRSYLLRMRKLVLLAVRFINLKFLMKLFLVFIIRLCPLLFIFYRMKGFQKLWKMLFISSKTLFSFSRYSIFCKFFPFPTRSLLFFIILSIKRDWMQRKKSSQLFKSFLIILFQSIVFSKEFLACIGSFGLFTSIKASLGLSFGAHFLHTFSIKMFPI